MDAKSMGAATLERRNDIKIGGKFDCDSNGDIYRHKNYRQIFLPLQVNHRNVYKRILFHVFIWFSLYGWNISFVSLKL